MNPKIVILDPSLKDERGHHYIFTSMISDAAVRLGFNVTWFVHKDFAVSNAGEGASIAKVFSRTMYDQFIKKKPSINVSSVETADFLGRFKSKLKALVPLKFKVKLKRHLEKKEKEGSFLTELTNAIQDHHLGPKDHIIVHTADGAMYRGVLDLLSIPGFSNISPVLHLVTPYDETIMPGWNKGLSVDRVVNYLMHLNFINSKVFLYAENDLLAKHLSTLFRVEVESMNIPVEGTDQLPKLLHTETHDKIEITYLGAAREEKGFLLLPELVELCAQSEKLKDKLRFTIQCTPQIIGYLPPISKAIELLKQYPKDFVTLLDAKLSTAEYNAMLEKADIVLCFYDRDKYKVRGSGIAVEAVAQGKLLIATANTFPAYVSGNAGIKVTSPKDAVEQLLGLVADYHSYKNTAIDWANKYRRENQSDAYLLRFLSRHESSIKPLTNRKKTPGVVAANKTKAAIPNDIIKLLTEIRLGGDDHAEPPLYKLIDENPVIND